MNERDDFDAWFNGLVERIESGAPDNTISTVRFSREVMWSGWQERASRAKPVVPPVHVMAKALSDRHAKELNIDKDDNWKLYGQAYIEDVEAMLTAAPKVDTK